MNITMLCPLYTGWRSLCLPCATIKFARSSLEAQRRQNGCLGRSKVVHRRFRHHHGRHGRREFLNMFKTVAQRSPRRLVAQRWLKGGRREAQALPWLQNGGTMVAQWSPGNRCVLLHIFPSIWAMLLPPLSLEQLHRNRIFWG